MEIIGIILTIIITTGVATWHLSGRLKGVEKDIEWLKTGFRDLKKETLAPAGSPRQLSNRGKDILEKSGIKKIIDDKKDDLLEIVMRMAVSNPYDAEKSILSVVAELPVHCPDVLDDLKRGAFNVGADIDSVLLVGGFYMRDLVFKDLGFSLTDLDKNKNKETSPTPSQ